MTYSGKATPTQPVAEHTTPAKPVNKALARYLREKIRLRSGIMSKAYEIACKLSDETILHAYKNHYNFEIEVQRIVGKS